ncbi:MAG: type IV-A pilus assembly ATPase PilB [Bdellovibrionales bacterium RIFCSPHIGHO2_01_FULL_40_29]|nr:MAG: type IV-A pilus assembly ATPase PilB [Bdellovibrionales bacterium RIFCSPHIGHO2_01_FULL_40_29]OFZ32734.1 MAG: type IV-A pilus assembly ATPase PilB [Bdellovibrionales bacterium RIFCSPHIGHO2_02_FULL_40_15]
MSLNKLGEILIKQGLIRQDQLQAALIESQRTKTRLGPTLVHLGVLKDSQILRALEKQYAIPGVDVSQFEIDHTVVSTVNRDFCERNCIIPISKAGSTLVVAFSDPGNLQVRDDLRYITKCKIQPVVSTESSILSAIEKYHPLSTAELSNKGGEQEDILIAMSSTVEVGTGSDVEDAPVVKFVHGVMLEAIRRRASDIHFEPYEKKFRVRFRVDGNLVETASPPLNSGPAIISRIKIMSRMDISEKRRPQDGRLKIKLSKDNREMDFRVSSIPTMWGEKIVMRLLDKSNLQLDMTKLGFEDEDLKLLKKTIGLPQGMVLITGPTGSGKTTTIYSALFEINKIDTNICTAEDPIEFNLEGINQVQMNSEIDLNFSTALRAFLRQDPDVVMVGEIRDLETAEISFKAASTGHMVVSTLHTNDAASTISRLIDMGVAPYIITSTLNLIVAQRLVGKICEACKEPVQIPESTLIALGVPKVDIPRFQLFRGRGCVSCNQTGIKGRQAIYELMPMTEKVKTAVLRGASTSEIRQIGRDSGFRNLRRSALLKLARGQTTVEEVYNSSVKEEEIND